MVDFDLLDSPETGSPIQVRDAGLDVPSDPVVPFITGDGIGPDITRAAQPVLDAAVETAYDGERSIAWFEVFAGEGAKERYGEWLPDDTLNAFRAYHVGIKGPLTTPVGGGFRSLNVAIRQALDLYACVRPVRYIPGVVAPVREPEKMDIVLFRENTEDVYSGIEYQAGSKEAKELRTFLEGNLGARIQGTNVGIGIKPVSEEGSKRLVRKAIRYAIAKGRESVTLVHKGNIMKFTEGAFRDWGYEVARDEFPDETITWHQVADEHGGVVPEGKILVQDVIADNMLQQLLTRTQNYDVIATLNLNGDYLSDAAAGQVGGLGMAPGGNIGDEVAVFEATHGTAPKYTGQDKVNPGSLILSGALMLEHLGWDEAADLVRAGVTRTIQQKRVTYDLAREMPGVDPIPTSAFGKAIVENIRGA